MSGDERNGGLAGVKGPQPATEVGAALGQVIVVGAGGLVPLPMVLSIWQMVPSYRGALLLGVAVLLLAALFGLGTAMRQGSAFTDRLGLRVGWTLLVATGGVALFGYCLVQLPELVPGLHGYMFYLLPALGLALVSAALTRPSVVRLPAVALIVLLVGGTTLAMVDRRADELAQRLNHAGTEADLVFVTALPGYGKAEPRAVTPSHVRHHVLASERVGWPDHRVGRPWWDAGLPAGAAGRIPYGVRLCAAGAGAVVPGDTAGSA
ncbi:hypothetical protein ACPSM1_18825 [Micromonospora chersina]|uniref:hypothetical protein n=1 Tax=Micromonospora chersina TaxID=47854 RepID=UPI003C8A01DB